MIKQIRYFFSQLRRVKQIDKKRSHLDYLLDSLQPNWPLADKIEWLIKLVQWIRFEEYTDLNLVREAGRAPHIRLRFVLKILDRRPDWKSKVAKTLREVLISINGLQLFCETGMSKEPSLFAEFKERLFFKILPEAPLEEELTHLIAALFPAENDAFWIQNVEDDVAADLIKLFAYETTDDFSWTAIEKEMEQALILLGVQVQATALTKGFRDRLAIEDFRQSALYRLPEQIAAFIEGNHRGKDRNSLMSLLSGLNAGAVELESIYHKLNESGVSMQIVFQSQKCKESLARIRVLSLLLSSEKVSPRLVLELLAKLISDVHDMKSLRRLWAENSHLLSKKIVERTAATGEHYITKNRSEYFSMLRAAAGGGFMTAFTVYLKVLVLVLGLSNLMTGVFTSLNYAISFVAIHLLGFTLGTKQPAMTAPALAEKLGQLQKDETSAEKGVASLVEEIVCLVRSQVASVLGNVLLVIPVVLVLDALFYLSFGGHLMPELKAQKALEDVDIFSLLFVHATFTGVLLWTASIISGWADNWFAYRGLRRRLFKNRTFNKAFGKAGARKLALFWQENFSAIVGNVALGLLLGFAPELMKFIGLPLDVRHVTLSSGTLAAALPVLGWEVLQSAEFIRAVLGIVLIGALNVGVSFSLAFFLAVRARAVSAPQKTLIRRALLQRFFKKPWDFFLPF